MKAWVVEDISGDVRIYIVKPKKDMFAHWYPMTVDFVCVPRSFLPEGINPKWSDDEPIEVELKIEKV